LNKMPLFCTFKSMTFQAIRGMSDLLPDEAELWMWVEAEARRIVSMFHYREIRTPIVETLKLFARTLGDSAGIVEKEMYNFEDRQGKKIALRPEGTAPVIRAYIESNYNQREPLARFYYMGPMFRYERPQKGRYRQFHQIGTEVIGSGHPMIDAETIHLADIFFRTLGIDDLELEINSLGCTVCRPVFVQKLVKYLESKKDKLCDECLNRLGRNPLRILDCKKEACIAVAEESPSIQDYLCETCEEHFDAVLKGIGSFGSSYAVNPNIVRGLDYYQGTAFEFISKDLGAQNAVAGGGRYDGLVRLMGGPHVPGVGFAIGVERLVTLLQDKGIRPPATGPLVFFATMGDDAVSHGVKLANALRSESIRVEMNYEDKGLKALMKRADRLSANFTVIIGSNEVKSKKVILRNMKTKEQELLPLERPQKLIELVVQTWR
jgi:histidyl-tRNA synthetase